ncbi:4'-phosphopantetheinyl transferase superfamily protein [Leptobacterium flavescens]|uniref:4'-phosphopantetheinyl transferase superfamily protein n=1 Tax=Leptobacterium flavescens TaxID=472055 RepID=A0A6P0UK58_9FLAO|nr:4'-phosphopantetheinyl transferase superfamily protein [Leptobacterium flavescens]NER13685.1 4'-phosphopantetheinyl transferase superfamily protein [Leptobacterium flavescens]
MNPISFNRIELKPQSAHIWHISIDQNKALLKQFGELLSADEKKRAEKFYFAKDRHCFVIAKGALRTLLGSYLQTDPSGIRFQYGSHGKPHLDDSTSLRFNLSHSGDAIVLGFVHDLSIGVDVEKIKDDIELKDIAKNFFSKEEVNALLSLKEEVHPNAFFNCWTRKEAFIKAKGSGLSFPLHEFAVSLEPGKEAELLQTKWDPDEKLKWTLASFEPEESYVGAVAIEGNIPSIVHKNWNEYRSALVTQ